MDVNELIQNPIVTGVIGFALPVLAGVLWGAYKLLDRKIGLRYHLYKTGYSVLGPVLAIPAREMKGTNQVEYKSYAKSLGNFLDRGIDDYLDGKPLKTKKQLLGF